MSQKPLKSTDIIDDTNARRYFSLKEKMNLISKYWRGGKGDIGIVAISSNLNNLMITFTHIQYTQNKELQINSKTGKFVDPPKIDIMGQDPSGNQSLILRLTFTSDPNLYKEWINYMNTGKSLDN